MALAGADLRYLRRSLGSAPDDATLTTLYDTLVSEGNAYPLEWVILETLETRYADLIRNPAQFSVSGEYSQSTAENIKALEEAIAAQRATMTAMGIELPVTGDSMVILEAEPPTFVR